MLKQNKHKPINDFIVSANAPLEHMFGNHTYCDIKWCNALKAKEEGKVYNHPEKW